MAVIDSQVHAYAANTPDRPWHGALDWPDHVTGDEMVAAMDAVRVDGAILVSPFITYRYDASYTVEVGNAHPGRFGLVKPVDPSDPAVAEVIADWKATPGTVAVRIMLIPEAGIDAGHAGIATILREAALHDLPVNVLAWGDLEGFTRLVDGHPETRFVLDHLGLKQLREPGEGPPDNPFGDLPKVLALAERDNAVIKVSGVCTLSHAGYPYPDIWDPLARVFDAWGMERCLWGTDWTRAHAILSYEQGVEPFRTTDRLTDAERATLMGGACAQVYGWEPEVG